MRGHIPSYRLTSPASLGEALSVLAGEPGVWQPFAGGTDLMVLLESGKLPHKKLSQHLGSGGASRHRSVGKSRNPRRADYLHRRSVKPNPA